VVSFVCPIEGGGKGCFPALSPFLEVAERFFAMRKFHFF
jgi:hypothetical protein